MRIKQNSIERENLERKMIGLVEEVERLEKKIGECYENLQSNQH